ncbi:hypothetical protein Efla_003487 [Eimeria flavescens]
MKEYFQRSRLVSSPFFAFAAAAAGGAETLQQQLQQQQQQQAAIKAAVEAERLEYQQQLRRASKKLYCLVCEQTCVSPPALRCAACCSAGGGKSVYDLLPDGFDSSSVHAAEGDSGVSRDTSPSSGLAAAAAAAADTPQLDDALFMQLFGAGISRDREETPDLRPAVWCHHKSCRNDADPKGLLICSKCHRAFHAGCCDPPLNFEMVTRFCWQCADCKASGLLSICEQCFSNLNEERMLICDACDRAFHMECLDPPVDEVPDGDWFCKGCGYCSCCGRQLTEDEALDTSCFYSNRSRICPGCKEKHLRTKRGRGVRQGDLSFDSVYAACSSSNSSGSSSGSMQAGPRLCEVCVGPFESDPRGGPSPRVICADCKITVHASCAARGSSPGEFICEMCLTFRNDFSSQQTSS